MRAVWDDAERRPTNRCGTLPLVFRTVSLAILLAVLIGGGCARQSDIEALRIEPADYDRAFDAAVAVADDHRMSAVLRDRRAGIIETEPAISGSLFDPWNADADSFGEVIENTAGFERRRVRFEFVPAGIAPAPGINAPDPRINPTDPPINAPDPDDVLTGPKLLRGGQGAGGDSIDLLEQPQPLELRAWVIVERNRTEGVRRHPWSSSLTRITTIVEPDTRRPPQSQSFWTPIARDAELERRLLSEIAEMLDLQDSES